MNILEKLPFLKGNDGEDVIDAAEERKARIQFHRDKVRNGPVKFGGQTNGQFRRAQKRALARKTKNAHRNQKRLYWAAQHEQATLRGQLQRALVIPTVAVHPTPTQTLQSVVWIVERFAEANHGDTQVKVDEQVVRDALQKCLNRYETINGRTITLLPESYVIPVAIPA